MLALSIITLFAGPVLYHWMRRGGRIAQTFEQVLAILLALIVCLQLVPKTLEELGWLAVPLIVAGYLAPGVLEYLVKQAAHTTHRVTLMIAALGLGLHGILDGTALGDHHATENLTLAIVLHRFTVGLVIWLILQPAFGYVLTLVVLALISLATVAGYYLSEALAPVLGGQAFLIIQSVIIGTIIHGLIHRTHNHPH